MPVKTKTRQITLHLPEETYRLVNLLAAKYMLSTAEFVSGSIDAAVQTLVQRDEEVAALVKAMPALIKAEANVPAK